MGVTTPGASRGPRVVPGIVAGDGCCRTRTVAQFTTTIGMCCGIQRERGLSSLSGGNPSVLTILLRGGPVGPFASPFRGQDSLPRSAAGMLYDPVADLYVHFPAGKSLTAINPGYVGRYLPDSEWRRATPIYGNMGGCGGLALRL